MISFYLIIRLLSKPSLILPAGYKIVYLFTLEYCIFVSICAQACTVCLQAFSMIFTILFFRFEGLWRKMMASGRVQGRKLLICLPPLMKYWDHMIRNYALMLVVSQHYNSHPTFTDIYCMYSTVLTNCDTLHPTALLLSSLQHLTIPYHTPLYCSLLYLLQ